MAWIMIFTSIRLSLTVSNSNTNEQKEYPRMADNEKKVKQVCKCENCGNEAEMVVTCTLDEDHRHQEEASPKAIAKNKVQGSATCTNCGNEADMWIDI